MARILMLTMTLGACATTHVSEDETDAGPPAVIWECECWRKYTISSLANAAGPVVLDQAELPQDLLCATESPADAIADEICSARTYYCDCAECLPTEETCER